MLSAKSCAGTVCRTIKEEILFGNIQTTRTTTTKKNNPKTNSTQIFKTQDHLKISISNLGSLASETPMWFYYIFM